METVACPVFNKPVDAQKCLGVCVYADHDFKATYLAAKKETIPVDWDGKKQRVCLNCKHHNVFGKG